MAARKIEDNFCAKINREKLQRLLGEKTEPEFYRELCKVYGLDIKYPSFNTYMLNKTTWKLSYAMLIALYLNVAVEELFDFTYKNG